MIIFIRLILFGGRKQEHIMMHAFLCKLFNWLKHVIFQQKFDTMRRHWQKEGE